MGKAKMIHIEAEKKTDVKTHKMGKTRMINKVKED